MSRNGVDIGTGISTRPWANHRSDTLTQQSYEHIKSDLADASCAILFIIGFRRAGIENWVKYAILCVRMSLWLCLFASENQAFLAPYWRAHRPWTGSVQGLAGAAGGTKVDVVTMRSIWPKLVPVALAQNSRMYCWQSPLNRIKYYYTRGIQLGGEKPTGIKFVVSTLKRRNGKASTSKS